MTSQERETIIVYNEMDKAAEVFTYRGTLIRQLDALAKERPDEVTRERETAEGGVTFTVPKKWVKIRASRIMTDEQREELSRRARESFGRGD